jgi:glycosyltransferase involved in cell wall biosynthesis
MTANALQAIRGARIAHLIETDGPGGAERMLADIAGEFAVSGCSSVAFLPRNHEGWLTRELSAVGVAVEYYRLDRPFSPRCVLEMAAAFRAHRIDIAHSHDFTMGVYNAWATRLARIPHIITMHGGRYYAGRWQRRLALRHAVVSSSGVAAVSQNLATHLRHDLHVHHDVIAVIPNGIRPHRLPDQTLRRELGLAPDDRIVLAVGNLYAVKGHEQLIEALALVPASVRAHVVIAGRGELAESLAARASALGVSERLHLLGLRGDIPNLLAAADLFVQPSLEEGLPIAILEAMFAGRAIVASDVGEIGTALGEGSGLVVPPGDPAALAASILRVLDHPLEAAALGACASRRATSVYGLDSMVARYAHIYGRALRHAAGTPRASADAVLPAPARELSVRLSAE